MTIEELRDELVQSMEVALGLAIHRDKVPDGVCRYCGKYWRRWDDSRLTGHARCVVTPEFRAKLRDFYYNSPAEFHVQRLASELGFSVSVVRAWTVGRAWTAGNSRSSGAGRDRDK